MSLFEMLSLPFMRRAVLGLMLAGGTFPILGVLIVNLNLQVIRFALMHVGLLGGAVALVVGVDPLWGGVGGIAVASFLLGPIADRTRLNTAAAAGLVMTGSLALAFILFYKTGVPAMEAFNLFAGSVLMLQKQDMLLTAVLAVVIIGAAIRWYRDIQVVLFDQRLAAALGVPETAIRYVLLTLVGLAIAAAIRLVGALLLDALFLLPAMAALRLGKNLSRAFIWASILGLVTAGGGIAISVAVDLPIGASVAAVGVAVVGFSYPTEVLIRRKKDKKGVVNNETVDV